MPSNFLQSMLIFAKLKHFANKKSPLKKDNFKNIFYSITITATHLLRQFFLHLARWELVQLLYISQICEF